MLMDENAQISAEMILIMGAVIGTCDSCWRIYI